MDHLVIVSSFETFGCPASSLSEVVQKLHGPEIESPRIWPSAPTPKDSLVHVRVFLLYFSTDQPMV